MLDDAVYGGSQSLFVSASDGLQLHVRQFGAPDSPGIPVVCLPGLTRTVADFSTVALALAYKAGVERRVLAIDSRGRGLSGYDENPANYNPGIELADVIRVLTELAVKPAIFLGSSRGGILTMLLGATQPSAIAGVVLHDIGPVIEPAGLLRIQSYVGKITQPHDFADGAEILRKLFGAQFPKFTGQQWLVAAQRAWRLDDGRMQPTSDPRIANNLSNVDFTQPLPALWKEFDTLADKPMMVIRGGNSDILSVETIKAMATHHAALQIVEVTDEGHVPSLDSEDLIAKISAFVASCDARISR